MYVSILKMFFFGTNIFCQISGFSEFFLLRKKLTTSAYNRWFQIFFYHQPAFLSTNIQSYVAVKLVLLIYEGGGGSNWRQPYFNMAFENWSKISFDNKLVLSNSVIWRFFAVLNKNKFKTFELFVSVDIVRSSSSISSTKVVSLSSIRLNWSQYQVLYVVFNIG